MLKITVPGSEFWDEKAQQFVTVGDVDLELEHSLVSLSKWESENKKPFLDQKDRTSEETLSYIKAMTLTPDVPPEVYERLSQANAEAISTYMADSHTATWFSNDNQNRPNREIVTAEIIYYWMISFNIPLECEKWHLNRLFTLIRVFNAKNAPPKKMNSADDLAQRRALNAARKKKYNTHG